MSRLRLDRSLIALLGGFLVIGIALVAAFTAANRQLRSFSEVRHTVQVQRQLTAVLSVLQDAETGQRGFLITGEKAFLVPFDRALADTGRQIDALDHLVADNPGQRAQVGQLRAIAIDLMETLLQVQRQRPTEGTATIDLVQLRAGKALMDKARAVIALMQADEQRLLVARAGDAARNDRQVSMIFGLCGIGLLALGGFAAWDARRRIDEAMAKADELADANCRLRNEAESRALAEAQVRQMQKNEAISQLTGGIAHDFNNMLTIVIGSLDLAARRLDSDPNTARHLIGNARQGADRAAQLTARLLAFARQQPLAPAVLDPNKLVGGMSELLRHTIGAGVEIETVLAGGLWRTLVDAPQLENAILNLCVNARDAMADGGRLTIETGNAHLDDDYATRNADVAAGQYVLISVTDTGTGMSADVIDRAFDPFYTTKGPGKGTGLGLSQVHGFIKQSGGHIKIYSEAGVGTTVKLYLRRHYGDPAAAGQRADVRVEAMAGGEVVLVVDDDQDVRDVSVEALRELGYAVIEAASGDAALALLASTQRIDVLFTDVVMPGMTGRRLAELALAGNPQLRVLYTTGYTRNAIVHNGTLDPGMQLLAKPFTLNQLADKLRELLDH